MFTTFWVRLLISSNSCVAVGLLFGSSLFMHLFINFQNIELKNLKVNIFKKQQRKLFINSLL